MSKVVIDMSMSLDGFVAGPDDGKAHPLGLHGGEHVFDWYTSGSQQYESPLFRPAAGANRQEVERMFAESGAFILGGAPTKSPTVGTGVIQCAALPRSCSRTSHRRNIREGPPI